MAPIFYHEGKFPPQTLDWQRLVPLITPVAGAVARLDGTLQAIPNAKILISPLLKQEGVLSSRIEGTQATLVDVLQYEAGRKKFSPQRLEDIREIQNYQRALERATELIGELPICFRLLAEVHRILLDSVRGSDKAAGKYRVIQNYIGSSGCSLDEARFVPVSPNELPDAMGRWERFVNNEQFSDPYVQAAIIHAEFESIHPFLDGNGRIGRMLIPLFLVQRGILNAPTLYVSEYFERHRQEYVDRLLAVSQNDDWTGWCEFFLKAIREQAEINQKRTEEILALYQSCKEKFASLLNTKSLIWVLDFLFSFPVFSPPMMEEYINQHDSLSEVTIRRFIRCLAEGDIIEAVQERAGRWPGQYNFTKLIEITDSFTRFVDHP